MHQIFVKHELHTSDSLLEILKLPYLVFIESHSITFQWQGAFLDGKYIDGQSNCDYHPCILVPQKRIFMLNFMLLR